MVDSYFQKRAFSTVKPLFYLKISRVLAKPVEPESFTGLYKKLHCCIKFISLIYVSIQESL